MTGVERAKRTLNFEPTDRVPIYSHLRNPAAIERVTGMDFWADPWKATVRAYQVLEIDMVKAIAVPVKGKERPGYKINHTLYGMYKFEPDLRSLEEVVEYAKKLPSEQELRRDYDFEGAARAYEKGWRRHQEAVGDSTLIIWAMGGCFDTNIDLMGYDIGHHAYEDGKEQTLRGGYCLEGAFACDNGLRRHRIFRRADGVPGDNARSVHSESEVRH